MKAEIPALEDGSIDSSPRRRRPRRLSELFAQLARDADGPVSLGHIRNALGHRSFAPLLVLFASFNMLPLPPGTSAILGIPLLIISAQMVYGTKQAWLPRTLADRSVKAETFRSAMEWIIPRLARVERIMRPRYWPFWRRSGERIVGCVALLLAIIVTLPIPGGNWLPACATALLGVALSERDGVLLAIGGVVTVISLVVVAGVVGAAGFAASAAMGWLF